MNMTTEQWASGERHKFGWLIAARDWMDERGKPAWIIAVILGFVAFWPIGLAILAYLIWSKRMFSCKRSRHNAFKPTGNTAFDSYREETLKRLEEEQGQFVAFLQKLREAKDRAEFDDFMRHRQQSARQD